MTPEALAKAIKSASREVLEESLLRAILLCERQADYLKKVSEALSLFARDPVQGRAAFTVLLESLTKEAGK